MSGSFAGSRAAASSNGNDGKSRVLAAVNLVELVGKTVSLKRRGKDYWGNCPFHQEKSPSFKVDSAKQFFYCFGCKANGNAIDFVMKRDRVEFVDALKQLASEYHVELPRLGGERQQQNQSERQALLEAHSAACTLFEKLLSHPQRGAAAREYLKSRGFTAESVKRFQIGLAADSWDALLKSDAMRKFPPGLLQLAGLVKARENATRLSSSKSSGGGGHYDTFRNRLMFPIRDEAGRVIAFGGRVMPDSEDPAKYLNSPETPLFSKSRSVYGLDFARQKIVETRTVAVVEGYTDVVMAHQFGATNVVSILGTAMTEQHVTILRRFADKIVLLFDADTAGDAAVDRTVELFLTQPVEIAIASMPEGVDPDEYLLEHGTEAFQNVLATAQDALVYKWKRLSSQFAAENDLTGRQKAVRDYLDLLAGARGAGPIDPIRWGQALSRVSRLTDIPVDELNRMFKAHKPLRRPAPQAAPPGMTDAPAVQNEANARVQTALPAQVRAQRWILGVLLNEPNRWVAVQKHVHAEDFLAGDERLHRIADVYWAHQRDEGEPVLNEFLSLLDDESRGLAVELVQEVEALSDMEKTLAEAVQYLERDRQRNEQRKLVAELRRTSETSDPANADRTLPKADVKDEVELLKKLQEQARRPDLGRV